MQRFGDIPWLNVEGQQTLLQLGGTEEGLTAACAGSSMDWRNSLWAWRWVYLLLGIQGCCPPPPQFCLDLEGAQIPPRFPPAEGRTAKRWGPAPAGCLGELSPVPQASPTCCMLSPAQMKWLENIHTTYAGFISHAWSQTANGLSTLPGNPTLFSLQLALLQH